jgi:very-long-chain enoyl-CoA reductase
MLQSHACCTVLLELLAVHRFSHATMPIFNLFKNCSYYWGFAAYVAFFVNHPLYTPPSPTQSVVCLAIAVLCQLSNLYCHILQRGLRKPGDNSYSIPRGFLFNYITCANYTTEIYGWLCFSMATQTLGALAFCVAGAYQMVLWALQKHARLRKVGHTVQGRQVLHTVQWFLGSAEGQPAAVQY